MIVMVINSGSSSIKYQVFDMEARISLAGGILERIGEPEACLKQHTRNGSQSNQTTSTLQIKDHRQGFAHIQATLHETGALTDTAALSGIGHRVVHGGESFKQPTRIDAQVLAAIRRLVPLAPLHNPANLVGIEATLAAAPQVPQVAVFDTAFHQTIPPPAYRYALPLNLYREHGIRRYGFHGTSHQYVARQAAARLARPLASLNLITLHLGNGASMAAVQHGRCIDTSMGLTPLEGLIMGTRSGDIDPAIIFYLGRETNLSLAEIELLLNTQSGLRGLCGENDMRAIVRMARQGQTEAQLALEMYTYRLRKYIGAYSAVLGHVDALVFTGGIGENAVDVRVEACRNLQLMGIEIDPVRNAAQTMGAREIQALGSRVKILVVPTNEELEIAEQTAHLLKCPPPTEN
jgi:acetate kinase